MNEFIKNAICDLSIASVPREVIETMILLNQVGEDLCIQVSLDEYERSAISYELISLINEPESDLLSYFSNENLYFIDNEIWEGMCLKRGEDYNFEIDYSIMFDTNYASYINTFINNPTELNVKIRTNLEVLIKNDFRFDYAIYIIENYFNVFSKEGIDKDTLQKNRANFYLNLLNLEFFKNINVEKYKNEGVVTFDIENSEAYLLTDKIYNELLNSPNSIDGMREYFEVHKMMILYIIGIIKERFSNNKASHNKMRDIFKFMNEVAGLYFEREIKFTYEYFENPNKYKMFDKVQRGMKKEKLFSVIENIAWDFSIPRIIERFFKNGSTSRYFIPIFLTHDNNMKVVFNSYRVKGVIFNKEKSFFVPYSNVNILEYLNERKCKIDFDEFFSNEARKIRKKVFEKNRRENFRIIETEFEKLAEILKCS